jgi:Clp amino terminal domain, pathogenicity island component/SnoaL-like domain
MFERYSERARRVIFFARYYASQYGSPYIETEHLLLGLIQEDHKALKVLLPNLPDMERVRTKIESQIKLRERISTSIEVPLTKDSKRVLNIAAEEAEKLGHRHVGTEHFLLGLLRVEEGLAAKILREQQVDLIQLREKIRKLPPFNQDVSFFITPPLASVGEIQAYRQFVASLREGSWSVLHGFFAKEASFIDANGKLWSGHKEIVTHLETLLAPFATKNAKHHLEKEICRTAELWVGTVLWSAVHLQAHTFPQQLRMTLVFGSDAGEWSIFLLQITSIAEEQVGKPAAI